MDRTNYKLFVLHAVKQAVKDARGKDENMALEAQDWLREIGAPWMEFIDCDGNLARKEADKAWQQREIARLEAA